MSTSVPAVALALALVAGPALRAEAGCPALLDHEVRKLRSRDTVDLCAAFAGKPLLVVNTASHCGFTPQLESLEALHRAYKDRGLSILGVPSDDFRQAARTEAEAARICFINYGVTFTMLSAQRVRGPDAHPLFRELARRAGAPTWNFNKYLIDGNGDVVMRFQSAVDPMAPTLRAAVESLL